ncbi:hypothetical protein WICMUC_003020 [Wickerhamomyces mucosus]|uniref:Uncharacterized protein n=1 Tax=Wickerhamomyces mucosus TaxID=1378264 RepID=A0A9P8PNP5_9ASCO|nr:hypothetical protein WICMUC_003020 [Wickerhamomyces mucosus]
MSETQSSKTKLNNVELRSRDDGAVDLARVDLFIKIFKKLDKLISNEYGSDNIDQLKHEIVKLFIKKASQYKPFKEFYLVGFLFLNEPIELDTEGDELSTISAYFRNFAVAKSYQLQPAANSHALFQIITKGENKDQHLDRFLATLCSKEPLDEFFNVGWWYLQQLGEPDSKEGLKQLTEKFNSFESYQGFFYNKTIQKNHKPIKFIGNEEVKKAVKLLFILTKKAENYDFFNIGWWYLSNYDPNSNKDDPSKELMERMKKFKQFKEELFSIQLA